MVTMFDLILDSDHRLVSLSKQGTPKNLYYVLASSISTVKYELWVLFRYVIFVMMIGLTHQSRPVHPEV